MVAAVNGAAVGIGLSLALSCDLILAAESSFLSLAFVSIGLMPDGGSTLFVPAAVGKARAFEMALLGERVPAAKALEWGLVNAVHPDDELFDQADVAGGAAGGGADAFLRRHQEGAERQHLRATWSASSTSRPTSSTRWRVRMTSWRASQPSCRSARPSSRASDSRHEVALRRWRGI